MKLPSTVQDIADVIGRERALFLIGQLPRCYVEDRKNGKLRSAGKLERVILYVPKVLKPDHYLVTILGWPDARKMTAEFGGSILCPGNCRDVYNHHRDVGIRALHADGVPIMMLADWFSMSERRARQILEIPQEAKPVAANDNAPIRNGKRSAAHGRKNGNT